eukprot:COSAG05_NODE_5321_length_1208_cov_1.317403_1_plen_20_part_01
MELRVVAWLEQVDTFVRTGD